ncbi:ammonia-forming cytochrome c nitrite reductase subunit c552 [Thermodesulfobacteriota bacterium]
MINADNKKRALIFFILMIICGILFVAESSFAVGKGAGLPGFIGSDTCGECHTEQYDMWKLTPHANMLVDAKKHPDRIIANYFPEDFPFSKKEVFYTLGSHWLQKYLTVLDDGQIYQLPNVWNITEGEWEPYSIFDWKDKPYVIFCDGCHTVGFDSKTSTFFEEGVGCESCHGPGKDHSESEDPEKIVNPDKLTRERRDMICEQCHTDGDSTVAPGLPFPVGFVPGESITEYFSAFFMPKPKSKDWYWGTTDYQERHRMFMFWRSKFYSTSRACDVCGFDRKIKKKQGVDSHLKGGEYMSRNQYCGTCHRTIFENFTKHSRHSENAAACTDCHLPKLAPSKDRYSIHDHKFDFSRPKAECIECHYESDAAYEFKSADPLYYHIKKKFAKPNKYSCDFCHYKVGEPHLEKHNAKGKDCAQCHFKAKDGSDVKSPYKHNSKKLKITEKMPFDDLCSICHQNKVEHNHSHHETEDLKTKSEAAVKESCKRCHQPFMERW